MKIIISFCNIPFFSNTNLAIVDDTTKEITYLTLGETGLTGLHVLDDKLYAVSQTAPATLFIYDLKQNTLASSHTLIGTKDAHAITIKDNTLYVTSTGTEQVLTYTMSDESVWNPIVLWETGANADVIHVNGIAFKGNDLIISAFGEKKELLWKTASGGFIFNISQDKVILENLYHPHSVFIHGEHNYLCDSSRKRILKDGQPYIDVPTTGYVRGVYVTNDMLFCGISSARIKSRSLGIANNPNSSEGGTFIPMCKLFAYTSSSTSQPTWEIDFSKESNEIFDIRVWE